MNKKGLFEYIRKTSFIIFIMYWAISIILFGAIYYFTSFTSEGLTVGIETVSNNFSGFITSVSASFLVGTMFGIGKITYSSIFSYIVYIQLIFSGLIAFVLVDKILQKYIFPRYHIRHNQDKRIHTAVLMMSIFKQNLDKLKHEFKSKQKHEVDIKEIEAVIDGLYVAFLDIDKIFSATNIHRDKVEDSKHLLVLHNMEESLDKLYKFIEFLENNEVNWKDKHVEFWMNYIVETAEKIIIHFDEIKIRNPQIIIVLENVSEITQKIEKKI